MTAELFRSAPPIGHQHSGERAEAGARAAPHDQLGVVEQFPAAALQLVHKRVFLVGIERLVKAAQLQQGVSPGEQVAEDQLLLTGRPRPANRGITGAAGAKSQLAGQHPRENLFQRRRLGRAKVGPADHLHPRVAKMLHSAAEVARRGR